MTDRLGQMEVLLRVAERGSFTAAARELGVGQPAVSKAVAALERRLGVRLVSRGASGLSLTAAGEDFVARAREVVDLVDQAESDARSEDGELRGTVRVASSTAFGRLKLTALLLAFMGAHPLVRVHLTLEDGDVDLVAAGIDVAIRIGALPDSALTARRLGSSRRVTVAAAAYVAARGAPEHPSDLSGHECVVYTRLRRGRRWRFEGGRGAIEVRVRGRLHTDSSEAAREAVLRGFGIGHFPEWLCADGLRTGALVRLLPAYRSERLPVHALFPTRRLIARRTRALVEFLRAAFRDDPVLCEPRA